MTSELETDRTGAAEGVGVCVPRGTWGKFGRMAFTLALIAGGFVALGGLALGQQKAKPKAPAAVEAPAPIAAPAPAAATAPPGPEKVNSTKPAWTVACFSAARAVAPDCKIEQRLFAKETGRMMSIAMVDIPGATRQPTLFLQLPNNLALQQGVALSIDDGAATPVLLQSCDGNGCYATLTLTPALLEAMKTGKVMAVKAMAINREALTFQHLLTDFGAAFDAAK